ncbi:hypothetical protein JCM10908_002980 [Rhodotorula pacifica]|uniref:uncharacterized protein n=1 Tax=Rhodotorula pacifica TaxID=1495444 RepID=UPI00317DD4C9
MASPDSLSTRSGGDGADAGEDASSFIDRGSIFTSRTGSLSAHAEHDQLVPDSDRPLQTDEQVRMSEVRRDGIAKTARIFAQLDTIRNLQSEIAHQHASLEGVSALKPPAAGESTPKGSALGGGGEKGSNAAGGAGRSKEEKEKAQKEYQKTADEFAKREQGIEAMMAKLSDLSAALKTLHSLPAPRIFADSAPLPGATPLPTSPHAT